MVVIDEQCSDDLFVRSHAGGEILSHGLPSFLSGKLNSKRRKPTNKAGIFFDVFQEFV